jgi:uncharacterized protein YndB with AHSA1/START domain
MQHSDRKIYSGNWKRPAVDPGYDESQQQETKKEDIMAAQFQFSQVIDRPVAGVFHFYADEHICNHPRWDPDIKLEAVSDEPIGIGTIIRRRNSRFGASVEGTMEVVEYEPNRVIAMKIKDGPAEMFGRTTFDAIDGDRTSIMTFIDIPSMDDTPEKRNLMMSQLERSGQNMKQLMESEI